MRSTIHGLLLIASAALLLSGCQATKEALGMGKQPPNEFEVVPHQPLAMPSNFDLPPPTPGAPRPQEQTPTQLAEVAVVGNTKLEGAAAEPISGGEQAFLQTAGVEKADPKIRQLVNQEAAAEAEAINDSFYYKLIFWQTPDPPGNVVDAKGEQQRLQENAALGKPPTVGATPVIVRRKKAMLEGIF